MEKITVAPEAKPVPVILSVNPAPPAVAVAGATEVSAGAETGLIVNNRDCQMCHRRGQDS